MYSTAFQTARKPLIAPKFALDRASWPKADSGKASIFETLCVVGSAGFGAAWSDDDLQAQDWPVQPTEAYEESQRPAPINSGGGGYRILTKAPVLPQRHNRFQQQDSPTQRPEKVPPNAHVWAYRLRAQLNAEQAAWDKNKLARDRLMETFEWLAQRCRDGRITAYARVVAGGPLYPLRESEWNLENAFAHFISGGSFERFFPEFKGRRSAYLFFDRAQIESAVAVLGKKTTTVSSSDLSSLSPLLQLAVKLALAKGYTSKEATDTQAVREAEIRAAWTDALPDVTITQKMIEAISKVMSFPDAKAIQQGLSKAKIRKSAGTVER